MSTQAKRCLVVLPGLLALLLLQSCSSDRASNSTGPADQLSLQPAGSLGGLSAEDVVVVGDRAYIADQDHVLLVVDVSDRTAPVLLGSVERQGTENGVALDVQGSYAYVAVESDGMYVIDISQDTEPRTVGIFSPAYVKDVDVVGTVAYLADQDFGLRVVDISDPAAPVLLGSCPSFGPFGVAVAGDYAYCADNDSGLCIIDVSSPASPALAGRYRALQSTRHVEVRGDYAFLADAGTGPVIIDVSDPTRPTLTSRLQSACEHLTLSGDYAFISLGYPNGLAAVRIASADHPSVVDSRSTPTRTAGLDVDDGYVYVAAAEYFLIYSR